MNAQAWVALVGIALSQIAVLIAVMWRMQSAVRDVREHLGHRLTKIETLLVNGLSEDVTTMRDEMAAMTAWRVGHQAVADLKIKEYDRLQERQEAAERRATER